MTAREYLKQLWNIDDEITERMEELEELRAKAERCSAPKMEGMPGGGAGEKDPISQTVIRIVDLDAYINFKIDELINLRTKITEQIDAISKQSYRSVLRNRYVLRKRWEDIAETMHYSINHCYRLEKQAIREFERKYRDELEK